MHLLRFQFVYTHIEARQKNLFIYFVHFALLYFELEMEFVFACLFIFINNRYLGLSFIFE